LLRSGLVPKAGKSLWEPVQEIEWLGVVLNTIIFSICIPQRRIDKDCSNLSDIKTTSWWLGQWARGKW
jgi:hypothetical protein